MTEPTETDGPLRMPGWRLSLMLVGSAALGGIAVAVWNRRLLAQLRVAGASPPATPMRPGSDD